jgi:two-component system response regulator DegU
MEKKTVTIVLADDHKVIRQNVRELLEADRAVQVVGEAETGIEALELVDRYHPDILITDIGMAGVNGIEVTRKVKERYPETGTIVFSIHSDGAYISAAFKSGAIAYVIKGSNLEDLLQALLQAVAGGGYLTPCYPVNDI